MTTDWIARACQEALDKKLVPSDAHAEALKLVMREHYKSHIREINKSLMGLSDEPKR